eukprot:CAMPEP_0178446628 /NCGR_PEP_ID=MMETSP0689_2-20121128/40918_1 /TAXON_ID=160604 /ORGANISM="Amphidinium massartii, Strain CS-259" /LENGTH=294 /DNA_ID=CAMNT_0020071491 /DNA_START=399 /DNA_END=1284 /DNA_ORIENTATION=-
MSSLDPGVFYPTSTSEADVLTAVEIQRTEQGNDVPTGFVLACVAASTCCMIASCSCCGLVLLIKRRQQEEEAERSEPRHFIARAASTVGKHLDEKVVLGVEAGKSLVANLPLVMRARISLSSENGTQVHPAPEIASARMGPAPSDVSTKSGPQKTLKASPGLYQEPTVQVGQVFFPRTVPLAEHRPQPATAAMTHVHSNRSGRSVKWTTDSTPLTHSGLVSGRLVTPKVHVSASSLSSLSTAQGTQHCLLDLCLCQTRSGVLQDQQMAGLHHDLRGNDCTLADLRIELELAVAT